MGNTETRELPLTQWTHKHPEEYAKKLIKVWGSPTGVSKHSVSWEMDKRKPYIKVTVVDELIPHKFPKPHYDDIYTTISVKGYGKLIDNHVCIFAKISSSILVDVLKQEVTARCGGLGKNDVTLAFVVDTLQNKIKPTKNEYARRINKDIVTRKELDIHMDLV